MPILFLSGGYTEGWAHAVQLEVMNFYKSTRIDNLVSIVRSRVPVHQIRSLSEMDSLTGLLNHVPY